MDPPVRCTPPSSEGEAEEDFDDQGAALVSVGTVETKQPVGVWLGFVTVESASQAIYLVKRYACLPEDDGS